MSIGARLALVLAGLLAALPAAAGPLLVSLPPGLDAEPLRRAADEFSDLLSRGLGMPFEAHVARNDFEYLRNLEQGRYAVLIAAPQVLAALDARAMAEPVAQFAGSNRFVVVVAADDESIYQLSDLAGATLCAGDMPDLYALKVNQAIANPTREPVLVPVGDAEARVRRLLSGHCVAATLHSDRFLALDDAAGRDRVRIIYQSPPLPQPGMAITTMIPEHALARARQIILSEVGGRILAPLARAFAATSGELQPPRRRALAPLAALMDGYLAE